MADDQSESITCLRCENVFHLNRRTGWSHASAHRCPECGKSHPEAEKRIIDSKKMAAVRDNVTRERSYESATPEISRELGVGGHERSILKSRIVDGFIHGKYVYIVESEAGFVKIGVSSNPSRRIKELRTASPEMLELLDCAPKTRPEYVEEELHSMFSSGRKHGEWFNLKNKEKKQLLKELHSIGQTPGKVVVSG